MEYVVDFQGFHDDSNNFSFKELCYQILKEGNLVGYRKEYLVYRLLSLKIFQKKKKGGKLFTVLLP